MESQPLVASLNQVNNPTVSSQVLQQPPKSSGKKSRRSSKENGNKTIVHVTTAQKEAMEKASGKSAARKLSITVSKSPTDEAEATSGAVSHLPVLKPKTASAPASPILGSSLAAQKLQKELLEATERKGNASSSSSLPPTSVTTVVSSSSTPAVVALSTVDFEATGRFITAIREQSAALFKSAQEAQEARLARLALLTAQIRSTKEDATHLEVEIGQFSSTIAKEIEAATKPKSDTSKKADFKEWETNLKKHQAKYTEVNGLLNKYIPQLEQLHAEQLWAAASDRSLLEVGRKTSLLTDLYKKVVAAWEPLKSQWSNQLSDLRATQLRLTTSIQAAAAQLDTLEYHVDYDSYSKKHHWLPGLTSWWFGTSTSTAPDDKNKGTPNT